MKDRSIWAFTLSAGALGAAVVAWLLLTRGNALLPPPQLSPVTAATPAELREALDTLLEQRSLRALIHLVLLNGEESPDGLLRLGYSDASEWVERVEDLEVISTNGVQYVAAVVRQELFMKTSHLGYLFDMHGKLVKRFGTALDRVSAPNEGTEIAFLTLGSGQTWFVFENSYSSEANLKGRLRVFCLDDNSAQDLTVNHHLNGLAYTGTEEQATKNGSLLWFLFPSSNADIDDPGIAADGTPHPAVIRWIESEELFRGPSQIERDGQIVFEVDVNASERFQAVDLH